MEDTTEATNGSRENAGIEEVRGAEMVTGSLFAENSRCKKMEATSISPI